IQGLESADALKEYAEFWDMVSDATGESSTVLAEAAVSLKALGISAGEEGEALSAFGFIQKNTTMEIGEFINSIGRLAPEMKEMGMGINDAATIMGILQQEFGMTSRVAIQEFRTAVNSSEGDMNKLKESLGITSEMFDTYSQKVSESSTVIEENAKRNNELFTPLQKIQHLFNELKYSASGYIESLAQFAPALIAVGPAMKGIAVAGNLVSKGLGQIPSMLSGIVSGFKTLGGLLVANPWVIAIMAIVAAIVLIYENWDKVVGLFKATWEVITGIFNTLKESIGGALKNIWETVQNVFGSILDFLVDFFKNLGSSIVNPFGFLVEQLSNIFPALKESVTAVFESLGNFMAEKMGWIVEKCLSVWDGFVDRLKGVWAGLTDALKGFVNIFVDAINWIIGTLNKLRIEIPKWVPKFGGEVFGFNIPKIPRLHDGGTFRSPIPGGEGLALLRDKETIRTPEQEKALQSGASIVISQGAIVINTQRLDDREINRVGDKLMDVIISKSRAYNLRFGR
ncbi:MAG: phage tail tape measure protein, partial [Candidatus Izemoplasmatales bacterium]|nr:phage tail tape measure protein [Candidatus Izemoplasmatales bacterium]